MKTIDKKMAILKKYSKQQLVDLKKEVKARMNQRWEGLARERQVHLLKRQIAKNRPKIVQFLASSRSHTG